MPLTLPKRQQGHPARTRAPYQEKELAVRLNGRTTPASGALSEKGDVRRRGVVRVEAKTTLKNSFRVTLEMCKKIEDAALGCGELPVICVEFLDAQGKPLKELCITTKDVLDMISEWKERKA